jgi:hypothetical protein
VRHVTLISDTGGYLYGMRSHRLTLSLAAIAALSALAPAAAQAGSARSAGQAADCRFDGASAYGEFGRIRVFKTGAGLFGCVTDVGRAYRLDTGTLSHRSRSTRSKLFGAGDWIGFPARDRGGRARVLATNLRTGRTHRSAAAAAAPTALVVNFDGTLAWISRGELRTKRLGTGTRTLGSNADPGFLGLELEGCAVTWKTGGEQRSSSVYCSRP